MSNTISDQEVASQMSNLAASHMQSVTKHFNITLDYSEASLKVIDDTIATYHPNGFSSDETIISYGAYVGEVVRLNLGGKWTVSEERQEPCLIVSTGEASFIAYPVTWVTKRDMSEAGEAMSPKYAGLKPHLGLVEELSMVAPTNTPQIAEQTNTNDNEEISSNEIVMRGAATVFLLVAGADGTIDKKEVKAFHKTIEGVSEEKNPLFKASLIYFMSDPEACLGYHKNPLDSIVDLALLRKSAEQMNGDYAYEYCKSLYDLGVRVASASGGFLGMGDKIGEEEKGMLDVIYKTLRIDDSTISVAQQPLTVEAKLNVPQAIPVEEQSGVSNNENAKIVDELLEGIEKTSKMLKEEMGSYDPNGRVIMADGKMEMVAPPGFLSEEPMDEEAQISHLRQTFKQGLEGEKIKGYLIGYDVTMGADQDAFMYEIGMEGESKKFVCMYKETTEGIELGSLMGVQYQE